VQLFDSLNNRAYPLDTPTRREAPLAGRIRGKNSVATIDDRRKPGWRPTFALQIGMRFWQVC